MIIIKPNSFIVDLDPLMQEVQIITGGYVTEEKTIICQTFEKFASSGLEDIDFYVNETEQIFTFHYGYKLNLEKTIRAIDFFPDSTKEEMNKIFNIIMSGIKKQRLGNLSH